MPDEQKCLYFCSAICATETCPYSNKPNALCKTICTVCEKNTGCKDCMLVNTDMCPENQKQDAGE